MLARSPRQNSPHSFLSSQPDALMPTPLELSSHVATRKDGFVAVIPFSTSHVGGLGQGSPSPHAPGSYSVPFLCLALGVPLNG